MKPRPHLTALGVLLVLGASMGRAADPVLPEAGPENGGLRLLLVVTPNPEAGKEGYAVRLDLRNVTDHPIVLRAGWDHQEDNGNLDAYLEASTSIETEPPIAPWVGQVMQGRRVSPQPERTLKAGETLSISWQTEGRHLKNGVTDPNAVQDPHFPLPGLYAVHASLVVITPERSVRLRSNEQLVPVSGGRQAPKHTFGRLWNVDADAKTATLSLGSLHGIKEGDQFRVRSAMRDFWTLTVTHVEPEISVGRLVPDRLPDAPNHVPRLPEHHTDATLILSK